MREKEKIKPDEDTCEMSYNHENDLSKYGN
jgi:hypothetical protein